MPLLTLYQIPVNYSKVICYVLASIEIILMTTRSLHQICVNFVHLIKLKQFPMVTSGLLLMLRCRDTKVSLLYYSYISLWQAMASELTKTEKPEKVRHIFKKYCILNLYTFIFNR